MTDSIAAPSPPASDLRPPASAADGPALRVAIVNRFYPPDAAPTGTAAADLLARLRAAVPAAQFRVFTTGGSYRAGRVATAPEAAVERIAGAYAGRLKPLRLAASLADGRRLAMRAARWGDVVISLTDPPLLGYWVGRAVRRHRRRWLEWTMDLYPEAFAAAGLASERNPAVRRLLAALRRNPPDRYLCLGPRQAEWVRERRTDAAPIGLLPCGLREAATAAPPDWRRGNPKLVLLYAGNLGEAHSADLVADLVRRADPDRFGFLLAPAGAKAAALRRMLADRPNVIWRDYADTPDLLHADVHIACLGAAWTHVCVPSKAVSAVCLGRPILFAGAAGSDNWAMLGEAGWLVPERPDGACRAADIDAALAAIADPRERQRRTEAAAAVRGRLLAMRDRAVAELADWLGALAAGKRANRYDRS